MSKGKQSENMNRRNACSNYKTKKATSLIKYKIYVKINKHLLMEK